MKQGGCNKQQQGGLHFCLNSQVPFPRPRNIFLVVNHIFSQPVCLPLPQLYSQTILNFYSMCIICNAYF